jgi:hypothetical protein
MRNSACDEQFDPELTAEGLSRVESGRWKEGWEAERLTAAKAILILKSIEYLHFRHFSSL